MRKHFKTTWAQRFRAVMYRPVLASSPGPTSLAVPATADWDEAFLRVESYLWSHHIEGRVRLNQFTSEILTAARTAAATQPSVPPVTLAMQILHARIGEWMVSMLGEGDWTDERFRARGRLAILLAEIPQRCPERFLSTEEVPGEIRARLGSARLWPGPELRLTSMASAPLEFTLGETMEKKWVTFSRSAFQRTAALWLLIAGAAGVAWFSIR